MSKSLYDVLGVLPTASPESIRIAYENLLKQYADREPNPQTLEHLAAIELAHEVLSNPSKRIAYEFSGTGAAMVQPPNSQVSDQNDPGQSSKNDDQKKSKIFQVLLVISVLGIAAYAYLELEKHEDAAKVTASSNAAFEQEWRERKAAPLRNALNKLSGNDVPQDFSAAFLELKAIVEDKTLTGQVAPVNDNARRCRAAAELGLMLLEGKGMEKNAPQAALWFRRAVSPFDYEGIRSLCPDNFAMYKLGQMYEAGVGVEKDLAQAYAWFNIVAANIQISEDSIFDKEHQRNYIISDSATRKHDATISRDRLAKQLSPAELGQAQKLPSNRAFWGIREKDNQK